nr:hypothetical protein 9 [Paracoccaceae bacterium]
MRSLLLCLCMLGSASYAGTKEIQATIIQKYTERYECLILSAWHPSRASEQANAKEMVFLQLSLEKPADPFFRHFDTLKNAALARQNYVLKEDKQIGALSKQLSDAEVEIVAEKIVKIYEDESKKVDLLFNDYMNFDVMKLRAKIKNCTARYK